MIQANAAALRRSAWQLQTLTEATPFYLPADLSVAIAETDPPAPTHMDTVRLAFRSQIAVFGQDLAIDPTAFDPVADTIRATTPIHANFHQALRN